MPETTMLDGKEADQIQLSYENAGRSAGRPAGFFLRISAGAVEGLLECFGLGTILFGVSDVAPPAAVRLSLVVFAATILSLEMCDQNLGRSFTSLRLQLDAKPALLLRLLRAIMIRPLLLATAITPLVRSVPETVEGAIVFGIVLFLIADFFVLAQTGRRLGDYATGAHIVRMEG